MGLRKIALAVTLAALTLGGAFAVASPPIVGVARAAGGAGWISSTCYSHTAQQDPIVAYGPSGTLSSHLHDFNGALTTDSQSTVDSLRAGGTCAGQADDTAANWAPTLTIHSDTSPLVVHPSAPQDKDSLVYYKNPSGQPVTSFPDGFAMIVGNATATSPDANLDFASGRSYWKCGPGGNTHLKQPPTQCSSGIMVTVYTFPQFWDGVLVGPPGTALSVGGNEVPHMSFTRDAAHPIVLPRVQIFFRYQVGTAPIGTVTLASGPYYTAHADYLFGWNRTAFDSLVTRCINGGVNCGTNPAP